MEIKDIVVAILKLGEGGSGRGGGGGGGGVGDLINRVEISSLDNDGDP